MRQRQKTEAPFRYAKCVAMSISPIASSVKNAHDIVVIPGTLFHAEVTWERPDGRHLLNRLRALARVTVFDKTTLTSHPGADSDGGLTSSSDRNACL
jgi:hypothetical protein